MVSFLISVFLLTQNVAPAPQPKGFEDRFLDFSQMILVAGSTSKIVIKHANSPMQGSGTVAIQGGLIVSVVVLERATSKRWSKPLKYVVATSNIVAGVALGALARVDTSQTRQTLQGLSPTPTH